MSRSVLVVAMAVALAASAPTAARPTSAQAGCEQPFEPWFRSLTYPTAAEVPDLGTSVRVTDEPPDTDGDGVVDQVESGDYAQVVITRGDGTVTIVPGSAHDHVYLSGYGPQNAGDLDGDGHDELVVGVDQQGRQYLLPGTTSPGTHEIADVGVFLDGFSNVYEVVGDQDGDGAADLGFLAGAPGSPEWSVFAGPDLLAPGPGTSVTAPTPLATYPGIDLAAAAWDPGAPTILTGRRDGENTRITVHTDPEVELVVRDIWAEYGLGGVGSIDAWTRGDERFVSLYATSRGGTEVVVWNLTDPCARHEPTSGPAGVPEAPAAETWPGTATYTG